MSEPFARQSNDFLAQQREFMGWKCLQDFCRFMWSVNIEEYAGKKTAEECYQKFGRQTVNDAVAARKKGNDKAILKKFEQPTIIERLSGEEKERLIEFHWIKSSTECARQLARYKNLGLDDPLENGSERDLILAKRKANPFRKNPAMAEWVDKGLATSAVMRSDFDFVAKLEKIRTNPPVNPSDCDIDKIEEIEMFLLRFWDTTFDYGEGKPLLPLCFFDDKEILWRVEKVCDYSRSSDTLRKQWQRLGLLRSHFPTG